MRVSRFSIFLVVALLFACQLEASSQDVIREWNTEAVRLIVPSGPPVHQTRLMAIHQLAVHDAVNGITRQYQTYGSPGVAAGGASPEAAAIAAGAYTLCGLFPSECPNLYTRFLQSLSDHGLSEGDPGVDYGFSAAQGILDLRANDGAADAQFAFDPGSMEPGIWHPRFNQTSLRPGWGAIIPFVMRTPSQFRPEPPPDIYSEVFQRDLEEVRRVGQAGNSNCPRADGKCLEIALFWRDGSPVAVWNQPLQYFVSASGFDISTAARTYALVHTAAADSSIACWEAKYGILGMSGGYNFWRPQSAINFADGNTLWTPQHMTPPHPEYPSGHTTNSTAMATILELAFGDNPGAPIASTVGSHPTRQWDSFSEAADEVIDARVYSGIHFRNTDVVGSRLGRQVAQFVWTHALKPCKGNGTCS